MIKVKKGRPQIISREAIIRALNARQSRKELAKDLGLSSNTVGKAERREGLRLPACGAEPDNSSLLRVAAAIFEGGEDTVIANYLGISRQYCNSVRQTLKKHGVKVGGCIKCNELLSLVDGCYEIIEIYKPQSPAQVEWKKRWLEKARKLGASCE